MGGDLRRRTEARHGRIWKLKPCTCCRAEKGYIIVGQDTDGTVTPDDAGLSWAIGKAKPDFVGKRSLERASMKSANRKQLVGLRTRNTGTVIEEGAQVAAKRANARPWN